MVGSSAMGRFIPTSTPRRPYRGVNVWLRELSAAANGFSSPYRLSFKQAKAKGGKVPKSEHGTIVVFWKIDPAQEDR